MNQQSTKLSKELLENIINITPQTYQAIIPKLIPLIQENSEITLQNIIKSLFYGLWNFDKMINQHNLSKRISKMLSELSFERSQLFLTKILEYLNKNWNNIDHHRINKFMQLVRYLIDEFINESILKQKTVNKASFQPINQILLNTVFLDRSSRNGLVYHVIDIFYEIIASKQSPPSVEYLSLFEVLLKAHEVEHIRLHIIEKIYEVYKQNATPQDKLNFIKHLITQAKQVQNDLQRKNIYALIKFFKISSEISFSEFIQKKEEEKKNDKILPKHKKITKGKSKPSNNQNKNKKQINRRSKQVRIGKSRQQVQRNVLNLLQWHNDHIFYKFGVLVSDLNLFISYATIKKLNKIGQNLNIKF